MSKITQKLVFATVILVLVVTAVFVTRGSGSESAYNVPRMLGMENSAEERAIQFDGPPTTDIEGPFLEVTDAPVSFDMDVRKLPQVGPAEKRPMREMGKMPNWSGDQQGEDPVVPGT